MYLDLAKRAALKAQADLEARIQAFAALEAELIVSADPLFRFHSGTPAT
jgi:tRNA 2-(methylsulfanyl)-N6-isopentenyladenosine37 hydroxylase